MAGAKVCKRIYYANFFLKKQFLPASSSISFISSGILLFQSPRIILKPFYGNV